MTEQRVYRALPTGNDRARIVKETPCNSHTDFMRLFITDENKTSGEPRMYVGTHGFKSTLVAEALRGWPAICSLVVVTKPHGTATYMHIHHAGTHRFVPAIE